MNKKHHFKPGMSKGAIATAALAGMLFTQSIAGSLPENLKETAQKLLKLENPYTNLIESYEYLSKNRLDADALNDFLNKTEEAKQKPIQALSLYKNFLSKFVVETPGLSNGFEIAYDNASNFFDKIKENAINNSSLDAVLSDYFGDELVTHYYNTYHTLETNLKPEKKIVNNYDYAMNSLEAINNLYVSGYLKENQVKFVAEGYDFFKDKLDNSTYRSMAKKDFETRINLLSNYISAKQNNEEKNLEFFDWIQYNILKGMKFDKNPEVNDSIALKILKEGFEPLEIEPKKYENMIKAMEKYDFASLYEQAGVEDPDFMHGKIMQESGFNNKLISKAGAKGYTQLMKGTAQMMGVNRDNPEQNIIGGSKYSKMISDYLAGYPKEIKLLVGPAGYNWGHANIYKTLEGKQMPKETRNYIIKVNGYRKAIQEMNLFKRQLSNENIASNYKLIGS